MATEKGGEVTRPHKRLILTGQVYRSNDWRDGERYVQVLAVTETAAVVKRVRLEGTGSQERWVDMPGFRHTRINRKSFGLTGSRGFVLVDEPCPPTEIKVRVLNPHPMVVEALMRAVEEVSHDMAACHAGVSVNTTGGSVGLSVQGSRSD